MVYRRNFYCRLVHIGMEQWGAKTFITAACCCCKVRLKTCQMECLRGAKIYMILLQGPFSRGTQNVAMQNSAVKKKQEKTRYGSAPLVEVCKISQ